MRFKTNYIPTNALATAGLKDYWRTVDADNLNEAIMIAKRYCRKGYAVGSTIQDTNYNA